MPISFNFEGPETRKQRELDTRIKEMSIENLRRNIDDEYNLQKGMESAKMAQTAAFDPTKSSAEQAYAMRQYGEKVGYQVMPGTDIKIPMGTDPEMAQGLLENSINNVQYLRMAADSEQDPVRKTIRSKIAVAAENSLASKAKDLSAADLAFESNVKAGLRYADELENTIRKYGNYEAIDPEGSAKLGQLPYQMAIAYAKVVDPSSVAREGEVEVAQKYMVPTGPLTRNETSLSAVQGYRNDLQRRAEAYSSMSGRPIEYKPFKQQPQPQQQTYQQFMPQAQQQPAQQQPTQAKKADFIYSNGKLIPK